MVTEARWASWTTADLRPYVEHALLTFGPTRLMFGSDWPVCLLAASYSRVVDSVVSLVAELSVHERDAILAGTAEAVYGIRTRTNIVGAP
jgi:L-fuconolactonase